MIYSSDLRQRVLPASDRPLTNQQVADLFQVSTGTVERCRRQRRETGQISASKSTGRPRAIPSEQEELLRIQVAQMADATLADHCIQCAAATAREVSTATMRRALQRLAWTLKKKQLNASEQDPERRDAWWQGMLAIDPRRLVFVDETGNTISGTPRSGRAPRGQRCIDQAPRNTKSNGKLPSSRFETARREACRNGPG